MPPTTLPPQPGQLVGRATTDPQYRCGLLDRQDLGQLIESAPPGHNAKLATLDHDPKLRPCHSLVN
jgi:hypothetical protein